MNTASAVLITIFGTVVGSFLNVCIHRLPLRKSLMWPGSHCPHCESPVKPYDNIPILGYLWLRGRCRSCKAPISIQYPIIEVVTGAVFLGAYLLFDSPAILIQRLVRSEEHTSELQSRLHLVCRLLLEKKNSSSDYAG